MKREEKIKERTGLGIGGKEERKRKRWRVSEENK